VFVAFFAQTTSDAANRTDVYGSALSSALAQAAAAAKATYRAIEAAPAPATPAWKEALQRSAHRTIAQRLVGRPAGELRPGGVPQ
jgi:hypothetical protein